MADYVFEAELDSRKVLAALDRIDNEIDKLTKKAFVRFQSIEVAGKIAFNEIKNTSKRASGDIVLDINRINNALQMIDNTADRVSENFQRMGNSFQNQRIVQSTNNINTNLQGLIGKLGGAVIAFQLLEQIGQSAFRFLTQTLQEATLEAARFETVLIGLKNILDGNAEVASEVGFEIRSVSERLGTDATSLAQAFFPLVEGLEQFEELAKLAVGLKILSTATGKVASQAEIVRSIAEATSGDFRSLRQIFELFPKETDKLREAFQDMGIEGFIEALKKVFEARGINIDELLNTLVILQDRLREVRKSLLVALGAPIQSVLVDFIKELLIVIEENRDEIDLFVKSLGQLIAEVGKFTGDKILEFLQEADFTQIVADFEDFKDTIDVIVVLFNTLADIKDFFQPVLDSLDNISILGGPVVSLFNIITSFVDDIITKAPEIANVLQIDVKFVNKAIEGLQFLRDKIDSVVSSGDGLVSFFETVAKTVLIVDATVRALIKDLVVTQDLLATLTDFAGDPIEFITGRVSESELRVELDFLNDLNQSIAENTMQNELNRAELEKSTEAQLRHADAILKTKNLNAELTETTKNVGEALEEVNEKQEALDLELQRRRLEIAREQTRKEIDLRIDASREREKIARKFADKLEDLARKFANKEKDLRKDAARKAEDADKKASRKKEDREKNSADKRAEIELNFQRRLQDIRDKFQFDALEAIRQNDAIRFLRLRRQAEFEVREAEKRRNRDLEDLGRDEKQKRDKAKTERERDREDAKTALERKLADLREQRARELEALRIANERELREQRIKENQKRNDLVRSQQRQLEDFRIFSEQKQTDLNKALEEEFRIVRDGMLAITRLTVQLGLARLDEIRKQNAAEIEEAKNKQTELEIVERGRRQTNERRSQDIVKQRFDPEQLSSLELKRRIIPLAKDLGILDVDFLNMLGNATKEELVAIFNDLTKRKGRKRRPARNQFSGSVDNETSRFSGNNFVGEVLPNLGVNNFSLPAQSVVKTIDNRRNIEVGGINMTDPTTLSPDQIAIMSKVMKQIILESLGGV